MKKSYLAAAVAAVAFAAPASAAVVFTSTFEGVPGGPSYGTWGVYGSADGWTGMPDIELQNHVAGNPQSPDGGDVFVELDAYSNSAMYRMIGAGTFTLSYLYSPRPGVPFSSNGIEVFLNGVNLTGISVSGTGLGDTSWSNINYGPFTTAGGMLEFRASGTSDSLGGYVDNITLTSLGGVPEPASWALFILGFGAVGAALRRSSRRPSLRYV